MGTKREKGSMTSSFTFVSFHLKQIETFLFNPLVNDLQLFIRHRHSTMFLFYYNEKVRILLFNVVFKIRGTGMSFLDFKIRFTKVSNYFDDCL